MARAKPKPKPKPTTSTGLSKYGASTSKSLTEAGGIYDKILNTPLDKLDNTVPADQQNLINSLQAETDPSNAAFVGARSQEMKDSLANLASQLSDSPEMQAALRDMGSRVGRTGEMQGALDDLQKYAGRQQETQDILDKMKGGLDGLTAAENQGLREQSMRAATGQYQTALSNLQKTQAQSRVRGAAASAQALNLGDKFTTSGRQAEEDLMMKNLAEQDSRRGQYANTLSQAQGDESARRGQYEGALANEEGAEFGRSSAYNSALQNDATNTFNRGNDYASLLGNTEQNEFGRVSSAQNSLGQNIANRNSNVTSINEFNAGQTNTAAAARAAGITGIADYMNNSKYGDANLAIAKQAAGGSGGSHTGSTASGNTSSSYINKALGILEKKYPGITNDFNKLGG